MNRKELDLEMTKELNRILENIQNKSYTILPVNYRTYGYMDSLLNYTIEYEETK